MTLKVVCMQVDLGLPFDFQGVEIGHGLVNGGLWHLILWLDFCVVSFEWAFAFTCEFGSSCQTLSCQFTCRLSGEAPSYHINNGGLISGYCTDGRNLEWMCEHLPEQKLVVYQAWEYLLLDLIGIASMAWTIPVERPLFWLFFQVMIGLQLILTQTGSIATMKTDINRGFDLLQVELF